MKFRREKYLFVMLVLLLAGGWCSWYALDRFWAEPSFDAAGPDELPGEAISARLEPLPPVAPSRFLNTRPEATYLGAAACIECHPDEHASYLETTHSRSLANVIATEEPPDHAFDHPPTSRSYRVYRQDQQLHHRETIDLPGGERVLLGDFPLKYVIGSGEHARSYLVEIGKFLVESPVTWYATRQDWALSPGYDVFSAGFARPVEFDCLFCHAGRLESTPGKPLTIHAQAIDCERCHGPGSLHVQQREAGVVDATAREASSGADLTIVNPVRLTRTRNEAICAQCHFHSDAEVDVRGRTLSEFKPSQSLSDFRVHFALQTPDKSMVVTGHGEQMHLSQCYQQTETLTCTTCHNPHNKPAGDQRLKYYRQICLSCHDDQACGLSATDRRLKSPQDDCVACHMPSSSTDVRHVAATHHRIGIHQPTNRVAKKPAGTLVPRDDLAHLPQLERDRCLGVAYLNLAVQTSDPATSESYRRQAQEILQRVREQGLSEPVMEVALAKAYQGAAPQRTIALTEHVLQSKSISSDLRAEALSTVSNAYLRLQRIDRTIEALEQLVKLRRRGEDWFTLGICRYQAGDIPGAIEAVRQAVAIRPDLPNFHGLLAELYLQSGQRELSAQHQQRAQQFSQLQGRARP